LGWVTKLGPRGAVPRCDTITGNPGCMSQDSVQDPPHCLSLSALVEGEAHAWGSLIAVLEGDPVSPAHLLVTHWLAALGRLPLEDDIKGQLLKLESGLTQLLSESPRLLADPDGWLRPCLTELVTQTLGWYASGKESRDFLEGLVAFVTALAQKGEAAAKPLQALIAKQQQRALMLEARARDSELGMAKIQHAQSRVSVLLNQLVASALPETVRRCCRATAQGRLPV